MPKPIPKPQAVPKKSGEGGGYPYNTLNACLKLAGVIKDHGGGDVPKNVIASALGMGDISPSFYQICASTKCFGIVEGTRSLKLTELGHDYFFPTTESSSRMALLGFLNTPPVFASLIQRFDGKRVPGANLLANLIQRENGVPPSWGPRAAGLFLSTLADLQLLDSGGYLRYGANVHTAIRPTENGANAQELLDDDIETPIESVRPESIDPARSRGSTIPRAPTTDASPAKSRVYQFADGLGRLQTPYPLSSEEWESLKSYVDNVLKPKKQEGENDGTK